MTRMPRKSLRPLRNLAQQLVRLFFTACVAGLLAGCHGGFEEIFIHKNDFGGPANVSDCFIKILSRAPNEYNEKHILLFFRDRTHEPIMKKAITVSASRIRPEVDWQQFPKVKVTLMSQGQQVDFTIVLDSENGVTRNK